MAKAQPRYRSKNTGRYVSRAYAARHPDATFADGQGRRPGVPLLVAAGVAVAALAIAAAAYKRLTR